MARPRIFVSSTYYDLKHIRTTLEDFVTSLGYEPILSEKGSIAYAPDIALDESCYREASNADVFVLVVGGRYGAEVSGAAQKAPSGAKSFFEAYDSITKREYQSAQERDIPVYILIDKNVYAEYETYRKNRANKDIIYAHVDSVNIFALIEDILARPRNNPVQTFERHTQITDWLREQWAGLFKELIGRMSTRSQIASLTTQVAQLAEINTTMKNYLEEVMARVSGDKASAAKIIAHETRRLQDAVKERKFAENDFVGYIRRSTPSLSIESMEDVFRSANSIDDLISKLKAAGVAERTAAILESASRARRDANEAREALSLPHLLEGVVTPEPGESPGRGRRKGKPPPRPEPSEA